ncbi:MAG: AlpA family phage regulatory protein [Gammaproteobacteria bacterium]|nr:AlpA family phage regulatory protein [Gammaproteobacteria bacterium]
MASNVNTPPRQIWRIQEVTARTGFCRAWIYVLMNEGKFPQARKIGRRAVGWDSLEVQQWIDQQMEAGA